MQAALHQRIGLAIPDHLHGLFGRSVAVRDVDDAQTAQIEVQSVGQRSNTCLGPDDYWFDQRNGGGIQGPDQGALIARMNDDGPQRADTVTGGDQGVVFCVLTRRLHRRVQIDYGGSRDR